MAWWLSGQEGELEVNHQASPGLTTEQAYGHGYRGQLDLLREGKIARYKTLHCCHCGGCWVENPDRIRERHRCLKCNQYLCDGCHAVSLESDYVHRSIEDIKEMVSSGKWRLVSESSCRPVLLPMIGEHDG